APPSSGPPPRSSGPVSAATATAPRAGSARLSRAATSTMHLPSRAQATLKAPGLAGGLPWSHGTVGADLVLVADVGVEDRLGQDLGTVCCKTLPSSPRGCETARQRGGSTQAPGLGCLVHAGALRRRPRRRVALVGGQRRLAAATWLRACPGAGLY